MRQIIQIWIEDKHGALMRVVGIISATGANIRALTMKPDPSRKGASRITLVADVEPGLHQRVVDEMNRLVNVLAAVDATANPQATPWPSSVGDRAPLRNAGFAT
jgi:acetolactate synthase small subunit